MPITTSIKKTMALKRRYRAYQARVRALPAEYLAAIGGFERYLMFFGPGDGEGSTRMFEDLVELFEQSAASQTTLRAVVGEDPVEFAEAFLDNYPESGWLHKERRRLAETIERAAGDQS